MISYEEATRIAVNFLQDSEIPLQITHQEKLSDGWIFCFQSKEYIETGNISAQLAGNGPFLVDKDTGELHTLPPCNRCKNKLRNIRKTNTKPNIKIKPLTHTATAIKKAHYQALGAGGN